MKLGFCLYKFFPFGGLQRDFLRVATECRDRGHEVHIFVLSWEGDRPEGMTVHIVPVSSQTNHGRARDYHKQVKKRVRDHAIDGVIGFNKMPGLDVYFAADSCFEARAREQRSRLYRRSNRYRHYAAFEKAVFSPDSKTVIMVLTEAWIEVFHEYYGTQKERFHMLPPGISKTRMAPDNAEEVRDEFRKEFDLLPHHRMVLMVGSGFKTKGLDRALDAIASLRPAARKETFLYVVGQDNPTPFRRQIKRLHLEKQVKFLFGRHDVPRFLLGGDVLIHPAYNEAAGMVLLEAIVSGLPVLVTDVCGYAHYITDAGAGLLVESPFRQEDLNAKLAYMLHADERAEWQRNGIEFGRTHDLYSLPQRAADIIEQTIAES